MSATIDLFVCREADALCDGSETPRKFYETDWLLTDFSDTSGVFQRQDPGKADFVETIFSRETAHGALKTHKPVILADRKYPRMRRGARVQPTLYNFSSRTSPHDRYLVERTPLLQNVWSLCERRSNGTTPSALALPEFIEVLKRVPPTSGLFCVDGHTRPMIMFLEGLPESSIVIPIIGSGLTREFAELFRIVYLRPAIINL